MTLLLLFGLIALFVAHRNAVKRLGMLERELAELRALAVIQRPERLEETVPGFARAADDGEAAEPRKTAPQRSPWNTGSLLGEPPVESEAATAWDEAGPEPAPSPETLAGLFERLVGGRLLIWIGGIALAVAGVFLVRYSIEIGLVTPPVRMIMAAIFGLVLVAAGEVARRKPGATPDPRIAQALVGAGILVLYATPYGAHVLYGLIGVGTASVLMAVVSAAALGLSLRHGAPTAVLGLVGGFLTPLLVGDPDAGAVPLLFYLGLLNLALFALAHHRGWSWLAAAAVALSFFWTGALLGAPAEDALAAGVFVILLGVAASLVRPGGGRELRLIAPAAIALLQLAVLVARVELGAAAWIQFGLLSLATMVLALRRRTYDWMPALALTIALALLAMKTGAGAEPLARYVTPSLTILFAGFAWPFATGEKRLLWTGTASAALALPMLILRYGEPALLQPPAWGALLAALAIPAAALAWRHRARATTDGLPDLPLLIPAATAALLLMFAAYDLVPDRLVPAEWLVVAIGVGLAARRLGDRGLGLLALAVAGLAVLRIIPLVPELWATLFGSIAGDPALATRLPAPVEALRVLILPGALLLVLWRIMPRLQGQLRLASPAAAGVLLGCAVYVLAKQVFGLASWDDFAARGFAERMLITQALFAGGWLLGARWKVPGLGEERRLAGTILTAVAAARLVWLDLLIHNPVLIDQQVGSVPVLNLLLPAYLGSAFWLWIARRRSAGGAPTLWLLLFLAALTAGVMLMVRQLFQGSLLSQPAMPLAESYGYSLAALLLSIVLLAGGVRLRDKPLRFAGLVLLTLTTLKVFLIDAAELEGLLRILSFLGLGVALIGIGKLYGTVLGREAVRKPA